MENYEKQIFESTGLDDTARYYLLDTVRWTKFLAILGFVFTGFFLVVALLIIVIGKSFMNLSSGYQSTLTGGIGLIYIAVAGIYFYPVYALLRFSSCMKKGIMNDDRVLINNAFRYQKLMYKYIGILMIIVIGFYLLAFIAAAIV